MSDWSVDGDQLAAELDVTLATSDRAELFRRLAQARAAEQRHAEARTAWLGAWLLDRSNFDALHGARAAAFALGDIDDAIEWYEREFAVTSDRTNQALLLRNLAELFRDTLHDEESAAYFDAEADRVMADASPELVPHTPASGSRWMRLAVAVSVALFAWTWARARIMGAAEHYEDPPRQATATPKPASPPPAPPAVHDAGPPKADAPLVYWGRGNVTVGEVRAELERLPPVLRPRTIEERRRLMRWLAIAKETSSRLPSVSGTSPRERLVRQFDGEVLHPEDGAAGPEHQKGPWGQLRLVNADIDPLSIDERTLAGITPAQLPYRPPADALSSYTLTLEKRTVLVELLGDGAFTVTDVATRRSVVSDLSPGEWLGVELLTNLRPALLTTGNPIAHVTAWSEDGARPAPPPPPADVLERRYRVVRSSVLAVRASDEDAQLHWTRVARGLAHCLRLTLWEQRWVRGDVTIYLAIKHGEVKAGPPEFTVEASEPPRSISGAVHLPHGEACAALLARWRFPSDVDATIRYQALFEGTPWTDAELADFLGAARVP